MARISLALPALTCASVILLTACLAPKNPVHSGNASTGTPAAPVAEVDGQVLTERDLAPLLQQGLDRANALDRAINRAIAAKLGRQHYSAQVADAARAAELELAANVFASRKMEELLAAVGTEEIEARYNTDVKDADFNGYQLRFALFGSEEEARGQLAAAQAGKADALKLFQPVVRGADGDALFISRNDVPYNLGVFVAKLKKGEFTAPAITRNGYIVLQALDIKTNPKPELKDVSNSIRAALADERLAKLLADERKAALINIK